MVTTAPYSLTDTDLITGEHPSDYVLRFRDIPKEDKPREKLIKIGADQLSVAELVAIVWGVGTKSEDVLAMAKRTIKEYGERTLGNELRPERLAQTADIPLHKAIQIVAAFELGRRFYATSVGRPLHVRNARQAYQHLKSMGFLQKEQLRGLYLNSRYQIIHDEVISVGSLTSNVVHPREVFQPAIEKGAVAVIVAHNHPSGSLRASNADLQITTQLIAAGQLLGIELLDHLIIARERFISIKEGSDVI